MKKNKSSKNWVDKQKNDQFVKKSKIFWVSDQDQPLN